MGTGLIARLWSSRRVRALTWLVVASLGLALLACWYFDVRRWEDVLAYHRMRRECHPIPGAGETTTGQRVIPKSKAEQLALAAVEQVGKTTKYDPAYVRLAYPGGDVPIDRGVCTDVVVRALRKVGVDLQSLIHEDMSAAFGSYPNLWGLSRPDPNIDHRRVPNIATFLRRKNKMVPVTHKAGDYLPGDIVVWKLSNGRKHMGVVSNVRVGETDCYKIVHNIGAGTALQDALFGFVITHHFRYFPAAVRTP